MTPSLQQKKCAGTLSLSSENDLPRQRGSLSISPQMQQVGKPLSVEMHEICKQMMWRSIHQFPEMRIGIDGSVLPNRVGDTEGNLVIACNNQHDRIKLQNVHPPDIQWFGYMARMAGNCLGYGSLNPT
ncbi:hypothetical protein AMTRI_Chr01g135500 [Amborella trichopoda]